VQRLPIADYAAMSARAAWLTVCATLLAYCSGTDASAMRDIRPETTALQAWAKDYNQNNELRVFTDRVSIDADNAEFKLHIDGATWEALPEHGRSQIFANAYSAVQEVYCLQEDHRKRLMPGLIIRFVGNDDDTLHWQVTGPGVECK
jgi:hypothetical protein